MKNIEKVNYGLLEDLEVIDRAIFKLSGGLEHERVTVRDPRTLREYWVDGDKIKVQS